MRSTIIILFIAFASSFNAFGQKGVSTFGLQFKPIIPNRLIGTFEQDFNDQQFESTVKQKFGFAAGGLIRIGLTDVISLETGMTITQRNFGLNYFVTDSGYTATDQVRVVSYGLPVSALVYIRLADEWYMNTSLGAQLTMFPSDVTTVMPIAPNENFLMEGAYRHKVQGAALANVGFEYRTKDKGYWYLGASYHLPFIPIMTFAMSYEYEGGKRLAIDNIRGSYLTLDLRYFFHEKKKDR